MRKYIILFFLALAVDGALAASVYERHKADERSMGISLSPLQLFLFSLHGKYYLKLDEQIALTIPFVITNAPELSYIPRSHYFSSGVGLKYYFMNALMRGGIYSELELGGGYSIITPPRSASFSSAFAKGAAYLGYTWCFADHFALNLAAGIAYNHAFSHEARVIKKAFAPAKLMRFASEGISSGFYPTGELSLGYSW